MAQVTNSRVSIDKIKPDRANARKHTVRQVADIQASIRRFGFIDPLIITDKNKLLGGHARLAAAQAEGMTEVDCRVVTGLTPAQEKALGLALNRLGDQSSWNDDLLGSVLKDIMGSDEGLEGTGFSLADFEKMTAEPESGIEVSEIETGPVEDEFWISIRGPLVAQAHMLAALKMAAKDHNGVTVEQGTISIG